MFILVYWHIHVFFYFTSIQVLGSLQEQREAIAELRSMIEYQVRLVFLILPRNQNQVCPLILQLSSPYINTHKFSSFWGQWLPTFLLPPPLWQHAVGNRRISNLSLLHSNKFVCFLCFMSWIFKLYLPWCLCLFILGMKLSCNMWLHPILSPFSFNPLLSLFVFDCSALRGVSRRAWAGRWTAWRTRWTSWGRATTATPGTSRWSWTARRRRRWWGSSCAGAGWDQEQAVSLPIGGGGHRRDASRTGEMTVKSLTYIWNLI